MKYYKSNTIHVVEVPVSDFKIVMNDSRKKSAFARNYCNAGFFATYKENNQTFTLPVAHLVCDYDSPSQYTKKYCTERGKFSGNKFTFDSAKWSYQNAFYNKSLSTLLIKNNKAEIKDVISVPTGCTYAISGIPIMRNGSDVKFDTYVRGQGWDGSPLYGTWHIFIGLKKDADIVYVMGMKTTTGNMIKSAEAYKKFKALNMYDVIKLDGGGSFYMNIDGKAVESTSENRLINTIICFGDRENNNISKVDTNNNKANVDKNNLNNPIKDVPAKDTPIKNSPIKNILNKKISKKNYFAICKK